MNTTDQDLYYPCIADSSGKIRKPVSTVAMTKDEASDYLRVYYRREWLICDAVPQPINHHYFKQHNTKVL